MVIQNIFIVIMVLSLIDLTATYLYVKEYNTKFPKLDYTALEANPILRNAWKIFGMNKGMIIGGIVVFCLLGLIAYNMQEKWLYFLLGTLSMMCIYHLLNFSQLARMVPIK